MPTYAAKKKKKTHQFLYSLLLRHSLNTQKKLKLLSCCQKLEGEDVTTGSKYSRGDVGEEEKHEREYRKRLAGFNLHNVAVTPLWLVTSLRSLRPSSSRSRDQSCSSAGGRGRSARRHEAPDGSRTLRLAERLGKMEGSGGGV